MAIDLSYRKSMLGDMSDLKMMLNEDKDSISSTFLTHTIDTEIHHLFSRPLSSFDLNQLFTVENQSEIVGYVHFYGFDIDKCEVYMGYYLQRSYRGKGLLQSVCKDLIDSYFRTGSVNKINVITETKNKPSIKFLEKLNFQVKKRFYTFNLIKCFSYSGLKSFSLSKQIY